MVEKHKYLRFTIKALSLVNMWPDKNKSLIKQYYILVIIILTTFPILADFITQFHEPNISVVSLNENLVALSALYGVIYISICFIQKKEQIKNLVEELAVFEKFMPKSKTVEIEKSIEFYTKFFIAYGIIGNICYGMMPFLTYHECKENRSVHMERYGIPCGVIVRLVLPFKADTYPVAQIVIVEEIAVCTLGTTIILMITMLICGVLKHTTTHLKHLQELILTLSHVEQKGRKVERKVKFCVMFHTAIVDYSDRADRFFSRMMLLHITWTGFIISVLGFEIIMVTNFVEILRFVMHLAGWMAMLFIVCYYGQTLMDESSGISTAIYSIRWYEKPVKIQKDLCLMLLRAQRPLTLRPAGVKIMSLATFIGVLYTAYSYFTLLLKLKP